MLLIDQSAQVISQENWTQMTEVLFTNFLKPKCLNAEVMKLVGAVCKNLDITLVQAADTFGDYWVNVYSQKMYPLYYEKNDTARDFLLDMDNVHIKMTQTMKEAHPPRFEYEWADGKTLIMHYKSKRGLIDFMVGLTKGVGKFYKEDIKVSKLGPDRVQIVFP